MRVPILRKTKLWYLQQAHIVNDDNDNYNDEENLQNPNIFFSRKRTKNVYMKRGETKPKKGDEVFLKLIAYTVPICKVA